MHLFPKSLRFLFLILGLSIGLSSCQLARFVFYNFADIRDHKKFQNRDLVASPSPFQFFESDSGKVPREVNGVPFANYLEQNKTVAFLIIRFGFMLPCVRGLNKNSMFHSKWLCNSLLK